MGFIHTMTDAEQQQIDLLNKVLEVYDQKFIAAHLRTFSPGSVSRETINRWLKGKTNPNLTYSEFQHLNDLLPKAPKKPADYDFKFVDLFAGIGGLRKAFDAIGGECVLTSEWDEYAVRTYKANYYCDPERHVFNRDIRDLTLSSDLTISEDAAYKYIDTHVPDHDVLLAGFPCQPFSIAGVSKKNALGRKHGFECEAQGTLFFDVARILAAKRPSLFMLENVKNLKSHDKGKTFKVILEALDELGYWVSDVDYPDNQDPKVIDAQNFLPQHRERIVLVGYRKDLNLDTGFTLKKISKLFPENRPTLGDLFDKEVDEKYILTPRLWEYLFRYAIKHKAKGNGFGYGLVNTESVTRTLSARYYKDGSEILIDRGYNSEADFYSKKNQLNRPRRLTPRECSRLMGFDKPGKSEFIIPVSDTRAYKQFGNSVVIPVFEAVAKLMKPQIMLAREDGVSTNAAS